MSMAAPRALGGRTLTMLALAAAGAAPSLGQQLALLDDGPLVVGEARRPQETFYLAPGDLTLTLLGAHQQERLKSGDSEATAKQWTFSQLLGYQTRGYVYDPNFIELDIGVWGGVEEAFANVNGDSSNSTNPLAAWNLSATLLRNGEWPLTVYSKREETWIFRSFGGVIQTTTTDTGVRLNHRSGDWLHHLDASHITVDQGGLEVVDDLSYTQDRVSWFSNYRPTANQTLDWNYNFASIRERGYTDTDYTTHEARLDHDVRFGDDNRSSLRSSGSWTQYSRDDDVSRGRWTESLSLQHSDTLLSRHEISAEQTDVGDRRRTLYRARSGFTHYLYKSLTTTGNVGTQYNDLGDGGSSREDYANLTWNYRKYVPYGTLSSDLGLNWAQQTAEVSADQLTFGDVRTFPTAQPIVIIGPDINPDTIVVRDPSGLLYRRGIDYTTRAFEDRVEIDRIIGGGITDGQTVVLDYTRPGEGENTSQTHGWFAGVRYDISQGALAGLGVYARYARQDQTVDNFGGGVFIPNEFTDTLYGAEYRIGDFIFGAERQDHDSTVYPYDATRYFARYVRSSNATQWSINSTYTSLHYPERDVQDDIFTVSARVDHRFSTELSGDATFLWRNERSDDIGDTTGFEEQIGLRWKFRQVDAVLQVRATQLDTPTDERRYEFVRLGIERRF